MTPRSTAARAAASLTGLALAVLMLAPSPVQAQTPTGYSKQAVATTNDVRVDHDRAKLRGSDCLRSFARKQAQAMADQGDIFHQDLGKILSGCQMKLVGENVAVGYATGASVVKKGWMKSPDHRKNLLDKRYRVVAIAARKGADGRWYVSQVLGRHS